MSFAEEGPDVSKQGVSPPGLTEETNQDEIEAEEVKQCVFSGKRRKADEGLVSRR
jgi:hypothetical protein